MSGAKIRLYVDQPLGPGQPLTLSREAAHYLFSVMRQAPGDEVLVFNGRDGEWRARLDAISRKAGTATAVQQTAPQRNPPDLWFLFAPIKKARTDFIVEKAAELGAARILPVETAHTNAGRIARDRLQAHAIEAAEQCGGTYVPEVAELTRLDTHLSQWPAERRLLFCDEARAGPSETLAGLPHGPWAVLIGPEGGFSEPERTRLHAAPFVTAISLGPRILRADTAAVAALTLWQASLGDWT